jgi:ComF family protein
MLPEVLQTSAGPDPVNARLALYHYTGRPAQAVRRLKYERVLTHVAEMSNELRMAAETTGLIGADFVVPVPIHWTRWCERGFNQSELLAERFPNLATQALTRTRRTRQQVGLSAEERRANLAQAFSADPGVNGKSILLLDDVITSGGTARECARVLKDAGAFQVDLITYCSGGSVRDV